MWRCEPQPEARRVCECGGASRSRRRGESVNVAGGGPARGGGGLWIWGGGGAAGGGGGVWRGGGGGRAGGGGGCGGGGGGVGARGLDCAGCPSPRTTASPSVSPLRSAAGSSVGSA